MNFYKKIKINFCIVYTTLVNFLIIYNKLENLHHHCSIFIKVNIERNRVEFNFRIPKLFTYKTIEESKREGQLVSRTKQNNK